MHRSPSDYLALHRGLLHEHRGQLVDRFDQHHKCRLFGVPRTARHSHQKILSIIITFSGNEAVSLTQSTVAATSKGAKEPLNIPVTATRRAAALSCPSRSPPDESAYQAPGERMHRKLGTYHARPFEYSVFVTDINIPGNPNEFTVTLPAVKIDDEIIAIPAVDFVRRTKAQLIGAFSGSAIG